MSEAGQPDQPPPRTTLERILAGVEPDDHPLNKAVARVEDSLSHLERVLRQLAARLPPKDSDR